MFITLTPAFAGLRHFHELRAEVIVQVTLKYPFLDQHRFLGWTALVVDVERSPPAGNRSVVDYRAQFRSDEFSNQTGKS